MPKIRVKAARVIQEVFENGASLQHILSNYLQQVEKPALLQEICYGIMRHRYILDTLTKNLLEKPLKDKEVHYLLLVGLYQLHYLNIPSAIAVNLTVEAAKLMHKKYAVSLINACLRSYLRNQESLQKIIEAKSLSIMYSHPKWLLEAIQQDWPEHYQAILLQNNQHPPMSIRVNQKHYTAKDYQACLQKQNIQAYLHPFVSSALILDKPCAVDKLPYFYQGAVSIQDVGAQLAGYLLEINENQSILDACAAPGGKTGHIWECSINNKITAIDIDQTRVDKITENMQRLQADITIKAHDINQIETWWDKKPFDRILLDVPCSATGVIRRHPDIKWLRRKNDLSSLVKMQQQILENAWQLLAAEGILLYVTCSILSIENTKVIQAFLDKHKNAKEITIKENWGQACAYGRQILPGDNEMDGFYYAKLYKTNYN